MNTTSNDPSTRRIWITLATLAALFMFLPIRIQFIGEESVYAFYLQHMLQSGDYIHAFYRPPLFLWAGVGLQRLFDITTIELPLRIISILCSIAAAGFAALFAHKVFQRENAGIIAATVFLTLGEIQFWYGWFGYADAMFLFFIFASSVCIWFASQFRKVHWYALAVVFINGAFFTKALTAYAFFFSTLLITIWGYGSWRFFLRPINLLLTCGTLLGPWLWIHLHASAGATSNSLVNDIAMRFTEIDLFAYVRHFLSSPLQFLGRMMPVALVILWYAIRRREPAEDKTIRMILLILGINFLPYWLAPFSNMRHFVPLYSWGSLALTYYLLRFDPAIHRKAIIAIGIALALKIPFSFWVLPYLKERDATQDFRPVAADTLAQIGPNAPLRLSTPDYRGFAVAVYINEMRKSQPIVNLLHPGDHNVYVLAYSPVPGAKPIKRYMLFNAPLYLEHIE